MMSGLKEASPSHSIDCNVVMLRGFPTAFRRCKHPEKISNAPHPTLSHRWGERIRLHLEAGLYLKKTACRREHDEIEAE
jgi:hypothetical protein